MIVVTGSVIARDDSFAEIRKLSLKHVHRSRKEPGGISDADAGALQRDQT
jgi:hypothetical protein